MTTDRTSELRELGKAYAAYKLRQHVVKESINEILPYEEIVAWRQAHDRLVRAVGCVVRSVERSEP